MSIGLGGGVSLTLPTGELKVTLDNSGFVLVPGTTQSFYTTAYPGRIVGWYLTGSPLGSLVLDVLRSSTGIPTDTDSIAGTERPTLVNQRQSSNLTVASWNTVFIPGDTFGIAIVSVASITNAVLTLKLVRI